MNRTRVFIGSLLSVAITVQAHSQGSTSELASKSNQSTTVETPNEAIQSFGMVTFEAIGNGSQNAIVGAVRQKGSAGPTFPTGVTGYGSMEHAGNQAFGIFGRCDLGAHADRVIPGTCANELNAFNFSGPPSSMLPPDLSFGTRQTNAIALQLVAYGDFDSSIALNLAGGTGAKRFYVGEYINPGNSIFSGIFVDATAEESAKYGAILKASSKNIPLLLESIGKRSPENAVIEYIDGNGTNQFTLNQGGDIRLGGMLTAKSIVGLNEPLPISEGGTSANSADGARSSLGVAQSGQNADITSMTAINKISLTPGGFVKLAASTVASLPSCNARRANFVMAVTDAANPAYNVAVKGGGTGSVPVFCNGTSWTAH
jgi:hypothetical protein